MVDVDAMEKRGYLLLWLSSLDRTPRATTRSSKMIVASVSVNEVGRECGKKEQQNFFGHKLGFVKLPSDHYVLSSQTRGTTT